MFKMEIVLVAQINLAKHAHKLTLKFAKVVQMDSTYLIIKI